MVIRFNSSPSSFVIRPVENPLFRDTPRSREWWTRALSVSFAPRNAARMEPLHWSANGYIRSLIYRMESRRSTWRTGFGNSRILWQGFNQLTVSGITRVPPCLLTNLGSRGKVLNAERDSVPPLPSTLSLSPRPARRLPNVTGVELHNEDGAGNATG